MRYTVAYTPQAVESLRRLSPQTANLLYSWVEKNLNGCADPRAQGKGQKSGGRWRYRVGAYRLVCEIEENRIVVLAVTSDEETASLAGRDRRGQAKRRAPSVFLRSTARQPVKTAALLAVTALLVFAFVARSAEYLLIGQEVDRLGGFYRSVGGAVETGTRFYDSQTEDASQLIEYLEGSPYVKRVDVNASVSAILPDFPNDGGAGQRLYAVPQEVHHNYREDVFFYGTLQSVGQSANAQGYLEGDYQFSFLVDQVLVGTDTGETYMIREGGSIILVNPQDYHYRNIIIKDYVRVLIEEEEGDCLEYLDMTDVAAEMVPGQRYLVRGTLAMGKPGVRPGQTVEIRGEEQRQSPCLQFKPLTEDGLWYLPVAEGQEADFSDPRLAGLAEEMKLYDDNQHAARVYLTDGMENTIAAWESTHQTHLIDGRWITEEDVALKRPVCMAYGVGDESDQFHVGDTITMTLRDLIHGDYIAAGDEGYDAACWYGMLYRPEDFARMQEIEDTSVTVDVEVVGVYGHTSLDMAIPGAYNIYIPSSLVPESFTHYKDVTPTAYMVTYELTGPDVQNEFLAEAGTAAAAMGFQLEMPESGWENFAAATEPMKRSSLYNAAVFAAVMAAGLAIVAVVYFYMRRRELPIARAMGVPARTCVRQVMTPVLLLAGLPGIAMGSWLGWWWTARNAGETLSALSEFGTIDPAALPAAYLAAMAGIAFLLLAGMVLLGAVLMVRRPILELLQGAARAAVAEVRTGSAGMASPVDPAQNPVPKRTAAASAAVRPRAVPRQRMGLRAGLVFRFVWRQASRARLKTALTIVLAAGFTVGLAAIQLAIVGSQERIDWLYENTPVEAELIRTGEYRGNSIRRDTVQALQDTGYITDFYLEANTAGVAAGWMPYREDWNAMGVNISSGNSEVRDLLAFEDERSFLTGVGSGANVSITYFDGWNGAMFSGSYTEPYDKENEVLFPVIVPKSIYDAYDLDPGSAILVFSRSVRPFEVAGYYEGMINADDVVEPILMPLTALQTLGRGRVSYSRAHVTLDPALNRQLDQFEAALEEITSRQGVSTLRVAIWDEELRQAVAPLEGGIQLMRVLYPVTLILSLLSAAGVSVLFIMTSAKEAAILRIQGTTKLRTQVVMGLQQALTCFVGLIVGLASVLLYVGSARPSLLAGIAASSALCAIAYLAAAAIGAIASSAVVTSKNPLELLQVKE